MRPAASIPDMPILTAPGMSNDVIVAGLAAKAGLGARKPGNRTANTTMAIPGRERFTCALRISLLNRWRVVISLRAWELQNVSLLKALENFRLRPPPGTRVKILAKWAGCTSVP